MSVLDKTPPADNDAEMSLLGCVFLQPEILDQLEESVKPDDFYRGSHKVIYETMLDMRHRGTSIDHLTVLDQLKADKVEDKAGGAVYLIDLTSKVPTSSHWKQYAHIVRTKAIFRRLTVIGAQAMALGFEAATDDAEEVIAEVQSMVMGLSMAAAHDSVPVNTILHDLWKSIQEGGKPYITPPSLSFARLRAGDLMVVGAGTSVGKTALTLNWCDYWSERHKVTYFEYEMPEQDLMTRLVCRHSGVDYHKIQDGLFDDDESKRILDAMSMLSKRQLRMEEVWCDINTLMGKIRREALQGTEVIVIDHLGLIPFKMPKGMNHAKAVGTMVTNQLKRLAAELGIKIVLLVQMNREGQRGDTFPKLHHLRDSGEIEQDASVVVTVWSDKALGDDRTKLIQIREDAGILADNELGREDINLIRLSVEKNRNGATGNKWLIFHGDQFRYEDRSEDVAPIFSPPQLPLD